jgi:Ca2+-binding EF-hand superfamily protein
MLLAHRVMEAFDADKDGKISHAEFTAGFAKWFSDWNKDGNGKLSQEQLKSGINRELGPPADGGPGFGPPGADQ